MGGTARGRSDAMDRKYRWALFVTYVTIEAAFASPSAAQAGFVVQGQVYDAGSGAGVANAIVRLDGHGRTLTATGGYFRFDGVSAAVYTLRIDGFGYASERRVVVVDDNTTVDVPLDIAPFLLDSLIVERRRVELEGHVRDPARDLDLMDANVLADGEQPTRTDSRGRFRLYGVLVEARLHLIIRAFGYLPLDTAIVPEAGVRHLFDLRPDTVIERLVAAQVDRIEDRAAPRRAALMRPMNRAQLLRHAGRRTLADVLVWEYGERRLRDVECVMVDEEQLFGAWQPSSLFHILPEQLERIEFLDANGSMLRIYTREFMREMISRNVELRTPALFGWSNHRTVPATCL